jgi:hypothetical protein
MWEEILRRDCRRVPKFCFLGPSWLREAAKVVNNS